MIKRYHIFLGLLVAIGFPFFMFFALVPLQLLLGYFPGQPGWMVAEKAAKKKDVTLCNDIIGLPWQFVSPSPSVASQRISCIRGYAALTRDPKVCELLMPSSYGLDCVGGATESPICGINTGFEVQWHEGEKIVRSSLMECLKNTERSKIANQCCVIARVSGVRKFNDCSSLANDIPIFDNCLKELAFKNHDPSPCEAVKNSNIKTACIVSATALKQDPSICSGCTPPLD